VNGVNHCIACRNKNAWDWTI